MLILETGLFVVGAVLLGVGYRKSDRNILVAAAVLLFLAGSIGNFISGFTEGFRNPVR